MILRDVKVSTRALKKPKTCFLKWINALTMKPRGVDENSGSTISILKRI